MARPGRSGLALAAFALCALGWVLPDSDPERLRALGVGHLLRADAERGRAGEESLLAALSAAGGDSLALETGRASDPEVRRVFAAQLRALRGSPLPSGPAPRLAAPGEAADGVLVLDLRVREGHLELGGALRQGERALALPSAGRWWIPGRVALLPPVLAIAVALLFRRTLLALFLGILAGAIARAAVLGAGFWAPWRGFADVFTHYLAAELFDTFRIEILGFVVALLAMVGVMSRAGGIAGLVERLLARARSARDAQVVTWFSGLLIFFDDYTNCLIVGNTLRPLSDRLRVSREKLAYLVDSTAAPVAGLSLFSTWIAFQVSIFAPQLPAAGIDEGGYAIFVASLPYRFYCWLALAFAFAVAFSGRDFGPMRRAEARARRHGELVAPGSRPPLGRRLARLEPAPGMPHAARLALWPLAATLAAAAIGIWHEGGGAQALAGSWGDPSAWREVLFAGIGPGPIFRGSWVGLGTALFLAGPKRLRAGLAAGALVLVASLGAGLSLLVASAASALACLGVAAALRGRGEDGSRPHLGLGELARAASAGGSTLAFAVVLIFEAWMIGAVCADLGTADYLIAQLSGALRPEWLPLLLFGSAGIVAFATGSSWSTMSILLPSAVPVAAALGEQAGVGATAMVVWVVAAVLDGAIFGDHCSPISDTTVLSSVASGCDHVDHVRTQAPYAFAVAAAAVVLGYGPALATAGWPPLAGLLLGAGALAALLGAAGRQAPPAGA